MGNSDLTLGQSAAYDLVWALMRKATRDAVTEQQLMMLAMLIKHFMQSTKSSIS